jgi:hypothetical protein
MSRICFLADEDVSHDLIKALRSLEPTLDILAVGEPGAPAKRTLDPDLLLFAEASGRTLLRSRATITWARVVGRICNPSGPHGRIANPSYKTRRTYPCAASKRRPQYHDTAPGQPLRCGPSDVGTDLVAGWVSAGTIRGRRSSDLVCRNAGGLGKPYRLHPVLNRTPGFARCPTGFDHGRL